jgi:serine/threonine protein kinase
MVSLTNTRILHSRYKIFGVLGVGENRTVYQARDMNYPDKRKLVALKSAPYRGRIPERFRREADVLRLADHLAIPKFIEYFEESDAVYLVTGYVNGKDMELLLRITTKILPVPYILKWGIQLCDALSHLHTSQTAPLIARNIKLSNIMIESFGNVLLTDLSDCVFLDHNGQNASEIITYDDGYTAPERFTGDSTIHGDIYSMGALLHHILTRQHPRLRPPFSFAEYPVQQINPDAPAELNDVIQQAVAFEPEKRFQSAAEMKAALEDINARS